ncbi:hypothetical protein SK128_001497 [Halocaridina rubra]|uniref:BZIP domain-containing protein n=1 Tax=Halocaridina rubra TaxID=373956 RepID=A0AAN8XBS0_HALRR
MAERKPSHLPQDAFDGSPSEDAIASAHLSSHRDDDDDFLAAGAADSYAVLSPLANFDDLHLGDVNTLFPLDLDQLELDSDSTLPHIMTETGEQEVMYDNDLLVSSSINYQQQLLGATAANTRIESGESWSSSHSLQSIVPKEHNYATAPILYQSQPSTSRCDPSSASQYSDLSFQMPSMTDSAEAVSGRSSSSRKGYRHRHERVFGLSEDDQKVRNQTLNNEASQMYRERKKSKLKDMEEKEKMEEERRRKLKRQYQLLQKMKGKLKEELDQI